MATLGVKTFELTNGTEGEYGRVRDYPETASQTFQKGDPVKIDTAGRVLLGVDTETVYGIALANASGTTDAALPVMPLFESQTWTVTASAAGATQVTVRTDVGVECSYIKSTVAGATLLTVLDISDTTVPTFVVIDLDARDPLGDNNGRYLVKLLGRPAAADGWQVLGA